MISAAVALDHRPLGGEVQRHDRDVLQVDVLPDVQLGPVGDREHPQALARMLAGVVQLPQLGPLVLGIPALLGRAEAEHPLLGPALLLVAAGAAERRVEAVQAEGLLEALGLPKVGVQGAAVVERIDAAGLRFRVLVDQQVKAQLRGHLVAQGVHRPELPGGVDMQQRERRLGRIERLGRQVQHHRAVLADRVQHHRLLALGRHLPQNVDALRLQPLQMRQTRRGQGGGAHGRVREGVVRERSDWGRGQGAYPQMESSAAARKRDDGAVILSVDLGLARAAHKAGNSAGAVSFDGAFRVSRRRERRRS
jgi:hypothetical protein